MSCLLSCPPPFPQVPEGNVPNDLMPIHDILRSLNVKAICCKEDQAAEPYVVFCVRYSVG